MINGKVQNENIPIDDVLVSNSTTGEFSKTNSKGIFSIKAKAGETLSFTHLSFQTFRETVSSQILNMELIEIQVSDKVNRLDEVKINAFPNINAVSLGILDHQPEQLTTNQRRLSTAGDFKPIHLLGVLAGSLPVDPIINKISGKTDRIKKLVKFDKDEDYFDFIKDHHENLIKKELGISEEEFSRFVYFLISDSRIQDSIKSNNNSQLQFFIHDLGIQFREQQIDERLSKN
ncbi:MAG: hypothetical protein R6V36_05515 [Psychroflexus sp.]